MSDGFDFTLVFDVVVALLLVATIVYAAVLDRKLAALRGAKTEMEALIKAFSDSTQKAEAGLDELRTHAETTGKTLKKQVQDAGRLESDLKFLVDRGSAIADQLEGLSKTARNRQPADAGMPRNLARTRNRPDVGPRDRQGAPEPRPSTTTESPANPGESLALSDSNPGARALLKALQGMR